MSIVITTQPQDISAEADSYVHFTISATGDSLTYQWQIKTSVNGSWSNSSLEQGKTNSLPVSATTSRHGYQYRCILTDSSNISVISDVAILSVIGQSLKIVSHPEDFTGPQGSYATFHVGAAGDNLTYMWQSNTNGTWSDTSFATSRKSTLIAGITSVREGKQFRCVVSDGTNTITTDPATMYISKVVNSTKLNDDLTSVANAIRSKAGVSGSLAFPSGFISTIDNISTGGSGSNEDYKIVDKTISQFSNSQVRQIGNYAFYYCDLLRQVSIPSCNNISNSAFYQCRSMSEIYAPLVTTIGAQAFYGCSNLKTQNFGVLTDIGSSAFQGCSLMEGSITFSTSFSESIPIAAFSGCNNLEKVTAAGATSVGAAAFSGCHSLSSVILTSVVSIGANAFRGCFSLTEVSFPRCTSIGSNAFTLCSALESAYFGGSSGLSTISSYAFNGCSSLKYLTFLSPIAGNSVQSSAFYSCSNLVSVYVRCSKEGWSLSTSPTGRQLPRIVESLISLNSSVRVYVRSIDATASNYSLQFSRVYRMSSDGTVLGPVPTSAG